MSRYLTVVSLWLFTVSVRRLGPHDLHEALSWIERTGSIDSILTREGVHAW